MTLLELEMAEYQTRLNKTREKMKEERTITISNRNTSEMLIDVRGRIKELSKSAIAGPIKKTGEVITVETASTTTDSKNFANEITWIKENIERIIKVTADMMEKEAVRVSRNFKILPKEIGISHILKALLGAKSRDYMKFSQI
jgi:23S rRNA pseudoU1915 N3-methylase RlmH